MRVKIDQHTPLSVITEPFVDSYWQEREREHGGTIEISHGKKDGRGWREHSQRVNPHMSAWHHQLKNEDVLAFCERFYAD